ncbi:hypothetical protein K432DRAFT_364472 [Lepidopterella palustris CBS 459.81]|uniref:Uncharacterized protein n=1 Tax=Lepidopterella palustris CBS 459.81 TaxID=1314670 RepID=A0A8E2DXY9_9PEZI|nr:hypothetical protein K432DRAFT_364472 [Lepidopterella palustris CBS 459.81]
MFRPSTVRTALLLARQTPVRVARHSVRHESNAVKVQRVRFQQQVFTKRRLLSALIYSSAFLTFWHFVLPAIDDEDEAEDEHYHEEGGEELEPIFIPLGITKARPRTFYKGSDPEWQEFRKIAPDQAKHAKMRDQLVSTVRMAVANDPRFKARMGDINVTLGAHWLDIIFPDGPPIEYERAGIEISDDRISWATRPVTQLNYHRLNRALYPTAVFSSIYASTKYLFNEHTRQVKQYFGLPTTSDQHSHRHLNTGTAGAAKTPATPPPAVAEAEAAQRTTSPETPPAPQQSTTAPSPGSNPKEKNVSIPEFTPAPPHFALHIFANTLSRAWKPAPMEPPRGTIVVSGLIEVKGTKARMTMDVSGAYDPKTNKYVLLRAAVRRIQDISQRPMGGH